MGGESCCESSLRPRQPRFDRLHESASDAGATVEPAEWVEDPAGARTPLWGLVIAGESGDPQVWSGSLVVERSRTCYRISESQNRIDLGFLAAHDGRGMEYSGNTSGAVTLNSAGKYEARSAP
jgi:hypothetical protein